MYQVNSVNMAPIKFLDIQNLSDVFDKFYIHPKHPICLLADQVKANGNPVELVQIGQHLIYSLRVWIVFLHDLVYLSFQIFFNGLDHPCIKRCVLCWQFIADYVDVV